MTEPNERTTPTNQQGYQPSPLGHPERTFADGRWTLVLTREFGHPVNRVWEALTEPGQLRKWAPFVPDRDLAATGDVVMTMLDGDDSGAAGGEASSADLDQSGKVLESDPPSLLVYRWGDDVLRWELTSTADGTTLILRHTLDDEGFSSAVGAGWHLCFDVLEALMKGVPFGPVVGERAKEYGWDDLNRRYAEVFGVKPSFS